MNELAPFRRAVSGSGEADQLALWESSTRLGGTEDLVFDGKRLLVRGKPVLTDVPAGPQPEPVPGPQGEQGLPGRDGVDGKDGVDGRDGEPGVNGEKGDPGDSVQGLKGDKGEPGPPNELSIGKVVTVGPNEKADATITGESPHQTLNLKIPRGRKGEKGERGDDGQPGGGGGTVVIDGGGGIPEAPADGQQYARQNASWTVVTGDGSGAPGPPGVRGSLWFTGAGPPTDGTGMLTGDMYLDETTGDVYRWL